MLTSFIWILAIKACDGFHNMGLSTHREKCRRDRVESSPWNAHKFSGRRLYHVVLKSILYPFLTFCMHIWQVSEFCNQFHQTYFLTIEQEIFAVITDTFHKPGFKLHVLILQHLFCLVLVLHLFSNPHFVEAFHKYLIQENWQLFRLTLELWQNRYGM